MYKLHKTYTKRVEELTAINRIVFTISTLALVVASEGLCGFWEHLVKSAGIWLPANIRFIISAKHSLSEGVESPVEFVSLPRLSRQDFLLSNQEAYEFLNLPVMGLPLKMRQYCSLKDVIVEECRGLVAALRLSVDSLNEAFAKDINPSEGSLLQHFFSASLLQRMARCFGSRHSMPIGSDFKAFLKRCYANEHIAKEALENEKDESSFLSLKKSGILMDSYGTDFAFSSLLAKRYYSKWIFPNRSASNPSTLPELIGNVISSMSANLLKNSTCPSEFPKEAVFQHLFIEGLALFTKPSCLICPELSKSFPGGNKREIVCHNSRRN